MKKEIILSETQFKAIRSSGAGGQNVNKVSSKVVLSFAIRESKGLSEQEKLQIESKLGSRLTSESVLILNCDENRSQFKNKQIITKRFLEMLELALIVPKCRKATKIPRSVIEKRIKAKRTISMLKQNRKKPDF